MTLIDAEHHTGLLPSYDLILNENERSNKNKSVFDIDIEITEFKTNVYWISMYSRCKWEVKIAIYHVQIILVMYTWQLRAVCILHDYKLPY